MKRTPTQHKCMTCDLRRLSTELVAKPKRKQTCAMCKRVGVISCGNCEAVWYCSKEHQASHWHSAHQQVCDHLRSENTREAQLQRHDSNGELTRMFHQSRRDSMRTLEDLQERVQFYSTNGHSERVVKVCGRYLHPDESYFLVEG